MIDKFVDKVFFNYIFLLFYLSQKKKMKNLKIYESLTNLNCYFSLYFKIQPNN